MLRGDHLQAPPAVTAAHGAVTRSAVRLIAAFNDEVTTLEAELTASFEQHPAAEIIRSLPGLGMILGGRVLGEFGDDPDRYASAKSRKNYAGSSPITRASGRSRAVLARHIRNRRLADAVTLWAFCSLTHSPGARSYYDQLRARDKPHHHALRQLANRWVGILHGCLATNTTYDEHIAWPTQRPTAT